MVREGIIVTEGSNWECIKDLQYVSSIVDDKPVMKTLFTRGKSYFSESHGHLTSDLNEEVPIGLNNFLEYFVYIPSDSDTYDFKLPVSGEIGVKESQGKLSYELDFEFITQMAERMDANKGKYEPYNWQKPIDAAGLHRALARHFFQVMRGNYEDEGRDFGHLEALALNAMMINYQLKNHPEDTELEEKTDQNMNLISAFADHYETETGNKLPEDVILSFFNA